MIVYSSCDEWLRFENPVSRRYSACALSRPWSWGTAFGLVVYTVNMYGFTSVFPWFDAARDWIAVATHVAFGMVAAAAYRVLAR